jgi:hypothetical protein
MDAAVAQVHPVQLLPPNLPLEFISMSNQVISRIMQELILMVTLKSNLPFNKVHHNLATSGWLLKDQESPHLPLARQALNVTLFMNLVIMHLLNYATTL